MAEQKRPPHPKTPECEKAREALLSGDLGRARLLARDVLLADGASDAAKAEAREIAQATRVDKGALVTGLVILAVLVALFVFVYRQGH